MTVAELIAQLSALDPRMPVAVPLHSDYTADVEVLVIALRDNGGYLSVAYRPGTQETTSYAVIHPGP